MNYNSLMNKPTINYRELIGDNTVTEVGGITEEEFNTLMNTDLASYYTKAQIDDLFSRSYVYREKSGSIVTFDCPSSKNGIAEVTSEIVAVQAGTGDPSPQNIRPITGWSAVNVVISPTTDASDGTTYTTTLKDSQGNPLTCYGGTLDVVSGVLVVDRASVDLGTLSWSAIGGQNGVFGATVNGLKTYSYGVTPDMLCSAYKIAPSSYNDPYISANGIIWTYVDLSTIRIKDTAYSDATAFKNSLSGQTAVYELATPITYQLTPTAVKSLLGTNNIWCDTGDITVKALDRIIQG